MATDTRMLADQLHKILLEHSPEAVEAALEEVRARESARFDRVRQLILSLEPDGVRSARQGPGAPRKKKTQREVLESKIGSIRRSRNPNRTLIADFVEDVANKQLLATSSQLGAFGQMLGIPTSAKKADRAVMARRIADALQAADHSAVPSLVDQGRTMSAGSSSLQSWANVIVKHG